MIRFIVLVLAVLCLPFPTAAGQVANGAEIFERRCGQCHASAARVMRKVPKEPIARKSFLLLMLSSHHAPDEGERAELVDWLIAQ